ncbi:MAG: transglutaminaseTgpA domain-containing protein [bacterium]|nr:transglutaminaseTgpA domain-containing protein [bacterium]
MNWQSSHRAADRIAALALLACGILAVANLPAGQLPIGWLLAWTLPAMFFGCLRRRPTRPWLRVILASLTQVAAFALALEYAGALSRPAILACTILPPLGFVTVRRRDADAALGLFLSFCVLLVGVILGGIHLPLLAAYGVAACVSLRFETHLAARAASVGHRRAIAAPMPLRPVLIAGLAIALPCLFVAFAVDRTLEWLPSPLRSDDGTVENTATKPAGGATAGLDDSFDLGGGGVLADLAGEELVLVRTDDRSPMPTDLYLRSGYFDVPEMQRWRVGPRNLARPTGTNHLLGRAEAGTPERTLEIERFAGARNFVFVPPHATELRTVPGLVVDRRRLWVRQKRGADQTDYAVSYQELTGSLRRDQVHSRGTRLGLLTLPAELDRERYLDLLDSFGASGTTSEITQRIAAGLAARCRYDRIEPTGPYLYTIDNFLFADGDRRGYCMHFASAAAIMLRLRGIPCRIGVGLYGGEQDRREPEARIYGSQHAHAWVEIYMQNRGYVVFDPTPPDERGRRMPSELAPTAEADDVAAADAAGPGFWSGLLDFLLQPWLLLSIIVLAIVATLWPGSRPAEPEIVVPRSIKTARRMLVRILRALASRGHLRQRGQTLEQFGAILGTHDRLPEDVALAFRTYQEVRFGGYEFDVERERQLQSGIASALAIEPAVIEPPTSGSDVSNRTTDS